MRRRTREPNRRHREAEAQRKAEAEDHARIDYLFDLMEREGYDWSIGASADRDCPECGEIREEHPAKPPGIGSIITCLGCRYVERLPVQSPRTQEFIQWARRQIEAGQK